MPTLSVDSTIPQNGGTLDDKGKGKSPQSMVFPHLFFFSPLEYALGDGLSLLKLGKNYASPVCAGTSNNHINANKCTFWMPQGKYPRSHEP